VSDEKLSHTWSRMAFDATARVALVLTSVTGTRISAERKLPSKKSGFTTSASNHLTPSGELGWIGGGGCLLEWQRAQFWAKTSLPRWSTCSSVVRYFFPPGASVSFKGFATSMKYRARAGEWLSLQFQWG